VFHRKKACSQLSGNPKAKCQKTKRQPSMTQGAKREEREAKVLKPVRNVTISAMSQYGGLDR